jgi:hypothetical protein
MTEFIDNDSKCLDDGIGTDVLIIDFSKKFSSSLN